MNRPSVPFALLRYSWCFVMQMLGVAVHGAPWGRNPDRIGESVREVNLSFAIGLSLPQDIVLPNTAELRWMWMWLRGYEAQHLALVSAVLRSACAGGGDPTLVDSGANEGTWTLLAAAFGCHAVAVEPQPLCVRELRRTLARNAALKPRVTIHQNMLWPHVTSALFRTSGSCSGDASFVPESDGANSSSFVRSTSRHGGAVPGRVHSRSLDAIFGAHVRRSAQILLWHVDVEGAEMRVLDSASSLFAAGRIERVLVELMAERWAKVGVRLESGLAVGRRLFAGWACVVTCTGEPFRWREPLYGSPARRRRCDERLQGKPWVLFAVDVYCVHPKSIDGDAGLAALSAMLPPPLRG